MAAASSSSASRHPKRARRDHRPGSAESSGEATRTADSLPIPAAVLLERAPQTGGGRGIDRTNPAGATRTPSLTRWGNLETGRETMLQKCRKAIWLRIGEEDGQALVEYTLILALVSLVAIGLLSAIGTNVQELLDRVTSALASAI